MDDKAKAQKCRVIGLDEMKLNPLTPVSRLDKRDIHKLTKKMEEWFCKTDGEIDAEFNSVVNDKILYFIDKIEELPIENNRVSYTENPI